MHYVKYFDILGVNTAQIPCIELQGVPNAATEGAVGLLGMNMLSDDHEIYVCVAVNGSVYTWMPLKDGRDGVSVIKAELNDNGELIFTLSNGTFINLGVIKGERGPQGEQADLTKLKEKNLGRYLGLWLGTKDTFKELSATEEDVIYLFEDEDILEQIDKKFEEIDTNIGNLNSSVSDIINSFKIPLKFTYTSDNLSTDSTQIKNLPFDSTEFRENIIMKLLQKAIVLKSSGTRFSGNATNETIEIQLIDGVAEQVTASWSWNGMMGSGVIEIGE